MPDEACSNYEDILNNYVIGHKFAKEELGVVPKIGWQLDPFGHSSTFAKILSDMGYTSLYLGRVEETERYLRKRDKELEFLWYPFSDNQGY